MRTALPLHRRRGVSSRGSPSQTGPSLLPRSVLQRAAGSPELSVFAGSLPRAGQTDREEMSQVGPLSRNLILCTFLQEHGLQTVGVPDTTSLLHFSPEPLGDIPHEMAMRLAFIGDELEVRWMPPRVAQMPWMAVYSLAFTYTQTGLRGVLRSFLGGFTNLRGNRRFWSFLTLRDRVSPSLGRKLSLLLLLALLLDWGVQVLQ
ncbi:bcl-2-interacting killer isoform X4 [Artibeus jamaicensis]|uniref:bcl-2-interacting killer isoform X4 n=1 Tax=Artibeus jamaicensis TaxID=9417 RepID=UPI00235B03EB|nr:bcl-2-interacting killer isoform X4 [Artibeus jamaicensis]